MSLSEFAGQISHKNWEKFSKNLWFDNELKIWLDISKVNFEEKILSELENKFTDVFKAMDNLEKGAISNIDENRQVGHYWLRNTAFSPTEEIRNSIENELNEIRSFGSKIIKGEITNKINEKYTNVLWIGIGGSGLGPILIVESLQNRMNGLEFSFIDNIDPFLIKEKLESINDKISTTLFVVVSKSGGTPEPKIAMDIVRKNIESLGADWNKQAIAITMKDSKLYKKAYSENWLKIFNMPDWVGGRTSITSAVGLLPISLIEGDIDNFLNGASLMDQKTRTKSIEDNPAALLAISWYLCGDGIGKRDMVLLPYRDRLQVFSKYLQQLVMESLGKKFDRSENIVHQGISVFGNKGSTDQHAYVQQLRDGIDNFFCIFIELLDYPKNLDFEDCDNPNDFLSGFMQGTRSALSAEGRQSITITMDKLNTFSLGALIALFERAVSMYAELVNINAYDQPGVEAGKKAAVEVIELQKKVEYILNGGEQFSINELYSKINNSNKETLFFILRHICFDNKNYLTEGNWSDPESLTFQKIIH